jgi:metal-responsive CopG/Arc/MetJ family transcriptional regulator
MAKVMVSIPDELLKQIDAEAQRQGTTRSGLLQQAAKREIGIARQSRDEIVSRLAGLKFDLPDDLTAEEAIRKDRDNRKR